MQLEEGGGQTYEGRSGGGGGGEVYYNGSLYIAPGNYNIVIGNGGAVSTADNVAGGKGGNSSAFNITTNGGGGGGSHWNACGTSGGSGGGAGADCQSGGSSVKLSPGGLGNAGGNSSGNNGCTPPYRGGGGGGAGGAGGTGTCTNPGGGIGGAPAYNDINGTNTPYSAGGSNNYSTSQPNCYGRGGNTGQNGTNGIVIVRYTTSYSIVSTAGTGGGINPNGTTYVDYGGFQNFTITANPGYKIFQILVDNNPITITDPRSMNYPFNNVTANHTINASFEEQQPTENYLKLARRARNCGNITHL